MARAILERELTVPRRGCIEFSAASSADDAEIRRLLRENAMGGRIRLSLEREPDYFAADGLLEESRRTIIAREGARAVCVGNCTVRQRFVNGQACRVGYLGGLRLDASHAGRFDVLRRGYEFFRDLESEAPADFYFTSIAADNQRARNLLERGVRRMPEYEFIGEFVAVVIPIRARQKEGQSGGKGASADELVLFLNDCNRARQFAPYWSSAEMTTLRKLRLNEPDFCLVEDGRQVVACGAIWDQRDFKQTVIRGYAPWLERLRPALNACARLTGQPELPPTNSVLANAFVSHFAVRQNGEDASVRLLKALCGRARECGIRLLTLGFATNDPQLEIVRKLFRGREYRSRFYIVRWPGIGGAAGDLDGRLLTPEIALL